MKTIVVTAVVLIVFLSGSLVVLSSANAASYRSCPGKDVANGITNVGARNVTCASALSLARHSNSIKCFLNARHCTFAFRRTRWTCHLGNVPAGHRVTCEHADQRVRYSTP